MIVVVIYWCGLLHKFAWSDSFAIAYPYLWLSNPSPGRLLQQTVVTFHSLIFKCLASWPFSRRNKLKLPTTWANLQHPESRSAATIHPERKSSTAILRTVIHLPSWKQRCSNHPESRSAASSESRSAASSESRSAATIQPESKSFTAILRTVIHLPSWKQSCSYHPSWEQIFNCHPENGDTSTLLKAEMQLPSWEQICNLYPESRSAATILRANQQNIIKQFRKCFNHR